MHYQPSVNLHTGQLIGVEALMRWEDPDRGVVPPGDFIPLAEETGLIEAIGRLGVRGGLPADASDGSARATCSTSPFNLSPRQLQQADLLEQMLETIDATGVDQQHLIVEITESTALCATPSERSRSWRA